MVSCSPIFQITQKIWKNKIQDKKARKINLSPTIKVHIQFKIFDWLGSEDEEE